MGWIARLRALFTPQRGCGALDAVDAAELSHRQAVGQRDAMKKLRVEADHVTAQIRAHNEANRYDDFLARVIRGRH